MRLVKIKTALLGFSLLFIIVSGCVESDNIRYLRYDAEYEHPLDFNSIIIELSIHNIRFYNRSQSELNPVMACSFGESFNNISLENTYCEILNYNPNELSFINLRLYDGDEHDREESLDKYRPNLEASMDYITSIIFNATGKRPIELEFWEINDSGVPISHRDPEGFEISQQDTQP